MATSLTNTVASVPAANAGQDGYVVGTSATKKVGFWGATPVVQPTSTASVTTTAATSTTNAYGYTTAAQADAIVTSLNQVISKLTTVGILSAT